MTAKEATAWAETLGIARDIRQVLLEPADWAFVLLGKQYLKMFKIDAITALGAPTIVLCGGAAVISPPFTSLRLSSSDPKTYGVGNIGLKGEVVARMLEGEWLSKQLQESGRLRRTSE